LLFAELTRLLVTLFVGLSSPKIGHGRFDPQEDNGNEKDPHILLNEIGEIRSEDHPKEDATPLQRGDVDRGPHLGSEKFHTLYLCMDHLPNEQEFSRRSVAVPPRAGLN
jgi:hypothetical protein